MASVWDQKHLLADLVFRIRPDSQIVLDSNARTQKLAQFLNLTVKSGYVDPMPVLIEMAELAGLDPTKVVKPPSPPDKDVPQISMRFTGKDDLTNVNVMAMLVHHNQAPSPQDLETASNILKIGQSLGMSAIQDPNTPSDMGLPTPPPGGPGGPPGPPGPGGPPHPGGGPTPPPAPTPGGNAPPVRPAHDNWQLGDRVMKRSRDANG